MLGSSIKTPSNPVLDSVLKDSIDRFTKTGRQASPLSATDGNRVAQRHLSARWHGSPPLLVFTGELEPEAGPLRSIKRLPKQPENPCEDAGLLGSIKAQRASKRHNQCLTRASSPGGVKTKAQNRALFGSDSWIRDLARTASPLSRVFG